MNVRWDERAIRDIEAVHEYIAKDNPAAAKRVVERIEECAARLSNFPLSGRPGVVKGTRILTIPSLPYIVVHRVHGDIVDILAVLHTALRRRS